MAPVKLGHILIFLGELINSESWSLPDDGHDVAAPATVIRSKLQDRRRLPPPKTGASVDACRVRAGWREARPIFYYQNVAGDPHNSASEKGVGPGF